MKGKGKMKGIPRGVMVRLGRHSEGNKSRMKEKREGKGRNTKNGRKKGVNLDPHTT